MTQRIYAVDYMKIVIIAFVVIGHAGLGRETLGLPYVILANTVFRTAVPLFAMASGFFLFRTGLKGRSRTWIFRLLVLYVTWYAVFFLIMRLWHQSALLNLREFLLGFYHLWFLEALAIGAVLLILFARKGPKVLARAAIICAVIGLSLQFLQVTHLVDIPLDIYRSGPFYIFPFVAMGYLFALGMADPKALPWPLPDRARMMRLAQIGFALALVENTLTLTVIGPYALLEFPLGIFLLTPALFGLILRIEAPPTDLPLGQMALAIYIMHVLFLYGATVLGWTHPLLPALAGFFVPALVVLGIRRLGWRQDPIRQSF
ncbi:acyltransferase family protein [Paracoccus marinaquae]|uniref:Acyltransferase n=1 Tax=Paracoccus marinaquae TaxID=2841926 RepID=A0ABS6AN52_9RHOB|nr:acyltransferase [Paracoccus marinaquae]MBU3032000.1 acyltransferase [Paracoccus marinaquae]